MCNDTNNFRLVLGTEVLKHMADTDWLRKSALLVQIRLQPFEFLRENFQDA